MSTERNRTRKAATWAAVAAYLLLPVMTGWLSADHIECSSCLGENLRHASAVFGYVVIGGFALSYTKPGWRQTSGDQSVSVSTPMYREEVRETSFWTAVFLAGLSFMLSFNWKLFFL